MTGSGDNGGAAPLCSRSARSAFRRWLGAGALVAALGVAGLGCGCAAYETVNGGLGDVQIIAIGEVVEVDKDNGIAALRILDDMAHVKSGDVVTVDYSDAEVRYGCDVEFEEGAVVAVEALGLPLENPLKASRVMCRDCVFEHVIGAEAPPVGESWAGDAQVQAA